MKILIISSDDVIFRRLANVLYENIRYKFDVEVVSERVQLSIFTVLKQRLKKAGFISGMSQFLFKIYDVLVLRKKLSRKCLQELGGKDCLVLSSLNSAKTKEYLEKNEYDVVIGIATSIVSSEALSIPKHGFINIHPGVLPQYRGTGNFWAVVNRDWSNIGCTCHWMTKKVDVGEIIFIENVREKFLGLWDLNYRTLFIGVKKLSEVINNNELFNEGVDVTGRTTNFFSWYGFGDYCRFLRSLRYRGKSDAI